MITDPMMKARLLVVFMLAVSIVIVYLLAAQFYGFARARRTSAGAHERNRIDQEIRVHLRWYKELALIAGSVYAIFWGVPWVANHATDILIWIVQSLGTQWTQVIVATGVIALALFAYYEKRHHQFRHGVVEIALGIAMALLVARRVDLGTDIATMAALGACVYVVARGLANISERVKRIERQRQEDVVYDLDALLGSGKSANMSYR